VRRIAPVVVLGLSVVTGCYRYVATPLTSLSPGAHVAVEVTTRGAVSLEPRLGRNVSQVEGTVTSSDATGVTLALLSVRRRGEVQPSTWEGESLHLTGDDIEQLRSRQLSRGRTIVASTALGAAAVSIIVAIARSTGQASTGTGPRPTPNP
jgi:hypothetical protein